MRFSVERLLEPKSVQVFCDSHRERMPLLIERGAPHYYDELITFDEINDHLGEADLSGQTVRLAHEGREIRPEHFTYSGHAAGGGSLKSIVNKEILFSRFYDGYTIILSSYERQSAAMLHLCHAAERLFRGTVLANVYITPRASRGFPLHWDTEDVFILQFAGQKEWLVFDPLEPLACRPRECRDEEWKDAEPLLHVVLQPGDLLYLPRGFVHSARSRDDISAHVTLGVYTFTYADLLRRILEDTGTDAWLRRSLPRDFQMDDASCAEFLAHVHEFLGGVDVRASLAELHDQFAYSRLPAATRRLSDYVKLPSMGATTRVRTNQSGYYDFRREQDAIVLRFNSKAVRFPLAAEPLLRTIAGLHEFDVRSLDGAMAEEEKVALCANLVREGFLTIVG